MSDDNIEEIAMVRKVYMLPRELVDRISAFQQAKRLPSEVEAARRLLDEALKHRDTPELIVERLKERLASNGLVHAVGNDVLREHPLVAVIDQGDPDYIGFTMKSGRVFRVDARGNAEEKDVESRNYDDVWYPFPPKSLQAPAAIAQKSEYDDDEIPF